MAGCQFSSLPVIYHPTLPPTDASSPPTVSDLIDKLKALISKNKKKGTPATNGTTDAKTETPTAAAVPEPTKTETAAAPSSSEPTAPPAGKRA